MSTLCRREELADGQHRVDILALGRTVYSEAFPASVEPMAAHILAHAKWALSARSPVPGKAELARRIYDLPEGIQEEAHRRLYHLLDHPTLMGIARCSANAFDNILLGTEGYAVDALVSAYIAVDPDVKNKGLGDWFEGLWVKGPLGWDNRAPVLRKLVHAFARALVEHCGRELQTDPHWDTAEVNWVRTGSHAAPNVQQLPTRATP